MTPEELRMQLSYAINRNCVLLLSIFLPLLKHSAPSEHLHGYGDVGEEEDSLCSLLSVTRWGAHTVFMGMSGVQCPSKSVSFICVGHQQDQSLDLKHRSLPLQQRM